MSARSRSSVPPRRPSRPAAKKGVSVKKSTKKSARTSAASPRLLEMLVCPVTKTTLSYDARRQELISRKARLAFPIRNGVPVMLVDAARELE